RRYRPGSAAFWRLSSVSSHRARRQPGSCQEAAAEGRPFETGGRSVVTHRIMNAAGAIALAALLATPAFADKVKIDFWDGNSGDISKRVQEVCKHFNDSQADYEVACTSQGSYPNAVQNTIAAFRGGKPPTIVQVFDVGTLDLMLSDAYYPAYKLMADNG